MNNDHYNISSRSVLVGESVCNERNAKRPSTLVLSHKHRRSLNSGSVFLQPRIIHRILAYEFIDNCYNMKMKRGESKKRHEVNLNVKYSSHVNWHVISGHGWNGGRERKKKD